MTVHLFGGTWSPSCCAYALRRTAEDNGVPYSPAAVETITQNFYVDDCLKSMPTVSEAINLVSELKTLVAEGGFNLTKWTRLIRILACFTLIPEVHRTKVPFTGSLEAEHLQRAEEILIRHIQNQSYPEEIKAITRGRSIASSSPLARLRPVLQDGVLVVPGRLTYTSLPSHAKRPAILPACHPAVESLVRHVRERTAHSGRGYVLAELRWKYWIVERPLSSRGSLDIVLHAGDEMLSHVNKRRQTYLWIVLLHMSQNSVLRIY